MFHRFRTVLAAVLLIAGICVTLAPASAAGFEEDVAALGGKSFSKILKAVEDLGTSGDPRAEAVLSALQDGDLNVHEPTGKVVIAKKQGSVYLLTDPVEGTGIGEATSKELKRIRVNNRVRGAVRGALGALTLLNPDPGKRGEAADAVFKTRSEDMAPLLEQALAREADDSVKRRMERALAAVTALNAAEPTQRIEAISVLGEFPDPDVRSLLGQLAGGEGEVAEAAATALDKIEQDLAFWSAIGNVFQGLSLGSVLLLAAVGLAITFGVMGVINMAHGELVMLGAYTTFVVQEVFRNYLPGAFDYSLFIAVPAAFLISGLVGIALERGVIRFLYGRPLETLLATWGISLILQQTVRSIFGPTNREVGTPSWMSGAYETASGLVLTYNRITIIVFSLLVIAGIALVMRKTSLGLHMRAVTQNRRMAGAMGIRTGRVDALTFGLGSGIAGVAGVAISQIDNVSPNLGQAYIIDSFMVVVFGGVGNLWGTLVGAFSLGIVNKFLEPYAGAVLAKILVLVVIILFIQKRPRGLFAQKGRAVEA